MRDPFDSAPSLRTSPSSARSGSPLAAFAKKMGRYHVLRLLGRGGMGEVYEAYDPKLTRKVALKVLLPSNVGLENEMQANGHRARLLREAKTLARLSHPHIVAVYDVGMLDDRSVYLAMEFVVGRTFRDVLQNEQVDHPQLIAWLLQVGEGLAAAHGAGLTHRDVKPENVMVGTDGSVRVLDFGLARESVDEGNGEDEKTDDGCSNFADDGSKASSTTTLLTMGASRPVTLDQVTLNGAILGTPAYMAPEQLQGYAGNANADLFAYCCMFFEALNGALPFPTTPIGARLAAIANGQLKWRSSVPKWLRAILSRGLAYDPENRGPGLRALLNDIAHALERANKRRRRRPVARLALVGSLAWALTWHTDSQPATDPDCLDPALTLAQVWSSQTRETVTQGFLQSGSPLAQELGRHSLTAIDTWRDAWLDQARYLCPAYRDEHGLPPFEVKTREQARACLTESRSEVAALLAIWRQPTSAQVLDAMSAVKSLTHPQSCLDPAILALRAPLPIDPSRRQEVLRLRAHLGAVKMTANQGDYAGAALELGHMKGAVDNVHDLALRADYLGVSARLAYRSSHADQSSLHPLHLALQAAIAADRPELAAAASEQIWFVQVYRSNEVAVADELLSTAQAWVTRAGSSDALVARLQRNRGIWAAMHGNFGDTLVQLQQSLDHTIFAFGDQSAEVGSVLEDLGWAARQLGDFPLAQSYLLRSLELRQRLLGRSHSLTLQLRARLGEVFERQEDVQAGQEQFLTGLRDCMSSGLPDEVCAELRLNVVNSFNTLGDYGKAQEQALHLVEVEKRLGRRSYQFGPWSILRLAHVLVNRGELAAAHDLAQTGLTRLRAENRFFPEALAKTLMVVASTSIQSGNLAQAQEVLKELREVIESDSENRVTLLPEYHRQLGLLALAEHRYEAAQAAFEEGLAAAHEAQSYAQDRAKIADGLARALLAQGSVEAALEHAQQALAWLQDNDASRPALAVPVHQTLAEIHRSVGHDQAALAEITLARTLFDPVETTDNRLAPLDFLQAQIHWQLAKAPAERQQALAWAQRALRSYEDWDSGASSEAAQVRAWLALHRLSST